MGVTEVGDFSPAALLGSLTALQPRFLHDGIASLF